MDVQDGYYFISSGSTSGNSFLVCNEASGRATVQSFANRVEFLKTSSNMVFRVESFCNNAHLIYNEKFQLSLALQASEGLTITLQPLSRDDQKQWWILKKDTAW